MKLAILDDYQNVALASADWDGLGEAVEITVFNRHLGFDEDAIAAALAPFDILVIMRERTRFPASLIAKLSNLKLLVTTGMRNAAIDLRACEAAGVNVRGTEMMAHPAAEHAIALIMELFKKISFENRHMHEGGWQGYVSRSLYGATLGIWGLGRLGRRVARFGKALDMDVIAWSENLDEERCRQEGVRLVDRQTLIESSDVLSIHVLLSKRTRGAFTYDDFVAMKPDAFLVNTSRGPIVKEADMIRALEEKQIAGVGLDVFDVEPLPADHPLRGFENAILTGHTGYVVYDLYKAAYREAVEDIRAWQQGEVLRELRLPD